MALVLVRPETEVTIFPQTAVLPCFLLTNHRVVIPCLNHRRLKNELGISFLQMKVPSLLYLSRRERERDLNEREFLKFVCQMLRRWF